MLNATSIMNYRVIWYLFKLMNAFDIKLYQYIYRNINMCGSQSQVWHSAVALDLRSSIMITISIWLYQPQSHECDFDWKANIFSCDQAALWMVQSLWPSVRQSVSPPVTLFIMFPSLYHHQIVRSYCQWRKWCQCKRSRSVVKGQGQRGQNQI